jgi:hypothetical protein
MASSVGLDAVDKRKILSRPETNLSRRARSCTNELLKMKIGGKLGSFKINNSHFQYSRPTLLFASNLFKLTP